MATFFGVVLILNGIVYAAVGFLATRKTTKLVSRSVAVSTQITVCTVLLLVVGTAAVLGRPNTPEEDEFLKDWAAKQPPSGMR